jgi:hypothetical protein
MHDHPAREDATANHAVTVTLNHPTLPEYFKITRTILETAVDRSIEVTTT